MLNRPTPRRLRRSYSQLAVRLGVIFVKADHGRRRGCRQPTAPMLAFNVKTTEPVPVEERLRRHVDTSRFPSGHAFLKDLQGWREKMRSQRFGTNGAEAVRDGQLRYYALATHAEHHFRTVDLKNEAKVVFRWYDTFSTRRFVDQPDWAFERASVLFNVAGALSYLATSQERGVRPRSV